MKSNQIMIQTIKNVNDKLTESHKLFDTIIKHNDDLFDEQIVDQNDGESTDNEISGKIVVASNDRAIKTNPKYFGTIISKS